jgi:hypothetical protein
MHVLDNNNKGVMDMKRVGMFLIAFGLMAMLTEGIFAQSISRFSGKSFLLENADEAVDSNTTVSLDVFELAAFDGASTASIVFYGLKYASAAGMPRIKTILQGSFDYTNWVAVDTLGVDTLETFQKGAVSIYGGVVYPYWKLVHEGAVGNRDDSKASVYLYAVKPD